jgi:hypothetical protein
MRMGTGFLSAQIFESRRADRYSADVAVWFRRGLPCQRTLWLIRVDVCGMDFKYSYRKIEMVVLVGSYSNLFHGNASLLRRILC